MKRNGDFTFITMLSLMKVILKRVQEPSEQGTSEQEPEDTEEPLYNVEIEVQNYEETDQENIQESNYSW